MSTAFRVGVLVFLGLLFLFVGVFLIGDKEFLFSSTYRLKTNFQNVQGLNNGADVRVGGIHQGTVKEIDLPSEPNGEVTVVMKLHNSTRNIIKKDSRASIKTEGLLGDKFVEITFGSPKAADVANGDTIPGETEKDMAQEARTLTEEASQGIKSFRDDMDALQHNFLLRGYFKKRGYNDSSELTQNSISHVPAGKPIKEFDFDSGELFAKADSAALKNKKRLDEVGQYLQENPFGLVVITSSEVKGDSDKDHVLTEARAKAARDYLVQNFKLDDKRIKTLGAGKSKSADENSRLAILVYAANTPAATSSASKSN